VKDERRPAQGAALTDINEAQRSISSGPPAAAPPADPVIADPFEPELELAEPTPVPVNGA
jgi:hypothetical protein